MKLFQCISSYKSISFHQKKFTYFEKYTIQNVEVSKVESRGGGEKRLTYPRQSWFSGFFRTNIQNFGTGVLIYEINTHSLTALFKNLRSQIFSPGWQNTLWFQITAFSPGLIFSSPQQQSFIIPNHSFLVRVIFSRPGIVCSFCSHYFTFCS